MGIFDFLFKNKRKMIEEFMSKDAIVLDVRTNAEYSIGAIPNSKNIPLQTLNNHIANIKKLNKPVITCCASGMRSGTAANILNRNGIEAINGGGWQRLSQIL
ncbi:rhodanese-like domain-containing protein [Pontimicrobium aquaticum]|uniref:Rhodanese-like domain-containing protein n=1 Tax=Pontimicrobium aquaticum TaxID=2565367 RepID=A0A4U0EYU4_9FLAO|nr:rhodanese-like domain-containing protein [Pontimicrobium aquaticum]TJY37120.1 rhodanese-like domain-containing protein [Pontimicrobium aquaticum]